MSWMVSLNLVDSALFAALALLCAAIYIGLRRNSAAAWLALALLFGTAETMFMAMAGDPVIEIAAATVLAPAACLCIGESLRLTTGGRRHWPLLAVVAALVGLSLLLLALGAPFVIQTVPFQLAGALALGDSIYRLRGSRNLLDICLMLNLGALLAIFLIRIPVYPLVFDPTVPLVTIKGSPIEQYMLTASALLVPPAVFMLLARIVGGIIATHRTRAERDGLTGLLNRRAFDEVSAAAGPDGGAVIFCDIDNFKRVNDHFGHQVGDAVICAFAGLIGNTGHCAARIGGEEFALLLPGVDAAEAGALAEYIRARFHEAAHHGVPAGHRLSASLGVAAYGPGLPPASAFARADTALYAAKSDGRNRVVTLLGVNGASGVADSSRHAA